MEYTRSHDGKWMAKYIPRQCPWNTDTPLQPVHDCNKLLSAQLVAYELGLLLSVKAAAEGLLYKLCFCNATPAEIEASLSIRKEQHG
jgi:hypothetical protein